MAYVSAHYTTAQRPSAICYDTTLAILQARKAAKQLTADKCTSPTIRQSTADQYMQRRATSTDSTITPIHNAQDTSWRLYPPCNCGHHVSALATTWQPNPPRGRQSQDATCGSSQGVAPKSGLPSYLLQCQCCTVCHVAE